MRAKRSAGILLFRRAAADVSVLLVHPGGPYWAKKDAGAWSIPKGEHGPDESPEVVGRREFEEETGTPLPPGELVSLGCVRQAGGKTVEAFAAEGDLDAAAIRSNTFSLEWPPRSGRVREFPEVDRAEWFSLETARDKILAGQRPFIERLADLVRHRPGGTNIDGTR